jgi:hypothetical protein
MTIINNAWLIPVYFVILLSLLYVVVHFIRKAW